MRFRKLRKSVVVGGLVAGAVLIIGGATAFAHFPGGGKVVKDVAKEMELTPRELIDQVDEDNTISSLASDAGVDIQTIVDEAVAGYQERLDEAVTNERITQQQADTMIAQVQEKIDETLNKTEFLPWHKVRGRRHGRMGRGMRMRGHVGKGIVSDITQAMDVTLRELMEQVGEDGTIAQVATDAGVDVEGIVDARLAEMSEKLTEAVSNKRISQERADEALANAETKINETLNKEGGPSIRPQRRGRGGFGSPRGFGGPGAPQVPAPNSDTTSL